MHSARQPALSAVASLSCCCQDTKGGRAPQVLPAQRAGRGWSKGLAILYRRSTLRVGSFRFHTRDHI
jgi:hypothetical protein